MADDENASNIETPRAGPSTGALSNDRDERMKMLNDQLMSVWQVYIKFFTVFLTVNILALALVMEHVDEGIARALLGGLFAAQNLLAVMTGIAMSIYTRKVTVRFREEGFHDLSLFGDLGVRGGIANSVGHGFLIVAWLCINWV